MRFNEMDGFFRRVLRPVPPEDPLEGAIKMLLFSNLITVPITLSIDDTENTEAIKMLSLVINGIHFSALIIGIIWGCANQFHRHHGQGANNAAVDRPRF